MLNHTLRITSRSGRIKKSVVITSSLLLVFFICTALVIEIYRHSISFYSARPVPVEPIDAPTATSTDPSATTTPPVIPTPSHTPIIPLQDNAARNAGHAVGIAVGSELSNMSSADLSTYLDTLVSLGATWVRFDIEWGDIQYDSPEKFNWTSYDRVVGEINKRNLSAVGILLFTPEWARDPQCGGGAKCPPKNPSEFAAFAAKVAARYKTIHHWEIWNEPNSYDFWATKTNCDAYTEVLKASYTAIKNIDRTAFIITGGVAPAATDGNNISQMDFLRCIYRNGGKNYFDAFADHSYTFPELPSSNIHNIWAQMSVTSPSIRSIMITNGDANKKVWITEFGAPTGGPDANRFVSEAKQADTVTDVMRLYKTYNWVGPIFWYSLKDAGTTSDTVENFFGLIRADGSHKPAFTSLKNIISSGI